MNIDQLELTRAVRETRGPQQHDRVIVALSAFTYGYWHDVLLDFQRADKRLEFLIDFRIKSGCVAVRACSAGGPEGEERHYDLRLKEARAAGRSSNLATALRALQGGSVSDEEWQIWHPFHRTKTTGSADCNGFSQDSTSTAKEPCTSTPPNSSLPTGTP